MATSKQLEANKRSGRKRAKQHRAANSSSQRQAAARRKARRRQRTEEDRDRDKRMARYWEDRRSRWEHEMYAITSKALPNFVPWEETARVKQILRRSR